jgi:polysaccharide biosynthesis transport protein
MQPGASRPSSTLPEQGLSNYLQIDLARLVHWLRIKLRWILGAAVCFMLLGVIFSLMTPARYTVTSKMLVDPAGLQVVTNDLYERAEQRDTQLLSADSKLQTLMSRNVLTRVIEKLNLTDDREFVPAPGFQLFSFGDDATRVPPTIIALEALQKRVSARRDEKSFVIILSVWARDAQKAIRISEALIEEFKAELGAADSDGAGRMTTSLMARLAELKASVSEAEEAVEDFRRQNDLRSSQGELASTRSMSQVDTQLRDARQRLIAAESRYNQMLAGGNDSNAMQSTTLSALRTQYATLKQQSDEYARIYGPRHPRQLAVQQSIGSLRAEIDAEIARLTKAAQNEFVQAKTVVEALEKEVTQVSTDVFSENDAQIRLRELSREASARSAVYEAFLSRARLTAERQQVDTTNIRVISAPIAPTERSWPPSVVSAAIFGFVLGLTLGALSVLLFGIITDINRPVEPVPDRPEPREPEPILQPREAPGSLLSLMPNSASPSWRAQTRS